ncbi:MAG: hypothetical protein HeimC3_35020 [Candidatus Heimdallarchaeota archaeon LC_3]|nr:MAG: hypothetical protein HeimC3_35020 [Candidatus Heimdallarchaeota archaeon LC_3]
MTTSMDYNEKSVYQFKTFAQIFFYGHLLVFAFNFIGLTIISQIIAIVITLMFAYAIYTNSNSERFRKGIFIALLFAIAVIVENLGFFLPSSLTNVKSPETDEEFISWFTLLAKDLPPIIVLLIIVTITGGVSAIWFGKWFKIYLPKEIPQTNAFQIYGIIIILTNGFTLYSFFEIIDKFGTGNGTINSVEDVSLLIFAFTIMNFVLGVVKIIAIYKVYNRITIFYNIMAYKEPAEDTYKVR